MELAGDKLLAHNRLYKYMLAIFKCIYLHFGFQNRFNYKENSSSYKHRGGTFFRIEIYLIMTTVLKKRPRGAPVNNFVLSPEFLLFSSHTSTDHFPLTYHKMVTQMMTSRKKLNLGSSQVWIFPKQQRRILLMLCFSEESQTLTPQS